MPVIDMYATEGTFADKHNLAKTGHPTSTAPPERPASGWWHDRGSRASGPPTRSARPCRREAYSD